MSDASDDEVRHRVRQLLLSGDNIVKNRRGAERYGRARERYLEARQIAVAGGLEPGVIAVIDRRLDDLGETDGDGAPAR
jgi:hypothetical protein